MALCSASLSLRVMEICQSAGVTHLTYVDSAFPTWQRTRFIALGRPEPHLYGLVPLGAAFVKPVVARKRLPRFKAASIT